MKRRKTKRQILAKRNARAVKSAWARNDLAYEERKFRPQDGVLHDGNIFMARLIDYKHEGISIYETAKLLNTTRGKIEKFLSMRNLNWRNL